MSDTRKSLPHEATVLHLVDLEISANAVIQQFMEGLDAYTAERFTQIMQHIGFITFENGFKRPPGQSDLQLEHQAAVLSHETDVFLQGVSAYVEYLDED